MTPSKPKPRPSPAAGSAGDELVETLGLPAPSRTTAPRRRRQTAASPPAVPVRSVRVTVDLGDGDYEQLRTWATNARVAGSDVVRAAIAHLVAHPPALDDVLDRARAAKAERDRRRLGK